MKPLLAALLVLAGDGGPPRLTVQVGDAGYRLPRLAELAVPPPRPPSRVVVNTWAYSLYEKPFAGGYQLILKPWPKAEVIDAFIMPTTLRNKSGFAWTVYVGGKIVETDFAETREAAEAALTRFIGPLITERNARHSKGDK